MSFYQIHTLHHGSEEDRNVLISMKTMFGLFNVIRTKIRVFKTLLEIFSEMIFFYAPVLYFVNLQAECFSYRLC